MNIERKAKAYDEAIEMAKKELQACGSQDCDAARQIFRLFPELKESEDERIRTKLIEFFAGYTTDEEWWGSITEKDILAWFKKQKNMKAKLIISDEGYNKAYQDGIEEVLTNPHKYGLEKRGGQKPAEWSEEDKKRISSILLSIEDCEEQYPNLREYQYDIDWLKSLKERVQSQQKWSEEDEKMLSNTIKDLVHPWNEYIPDRIEDEIKWLKNKLKSFRTQNKYVYNPYKAVVDSIAVMVEKYAPFDSNLQDFYDNIKVKCKDAKEYDSLFP